MKMTRMDYNQRLQWTDCQKQEVPTDGFSHQKPEFVDPANNVRKPMIGAQWKLFNAKSKQTRKRKQRNANQNAARRSKEEPIAVSKSVYLTKNSSNAKVSSNENQRYYHHQQSCTSSAAMSSTNDSSQNPNKLSSASSYESVNSKKQRGKSHKEFGKLDDENRLRLKMSNILSHSDDQIHCKLKPGKYLLKPAITSISSDYSSSPFDSTQNNALRGKVASIEYTKVVTEESLTQMEETIREMSTYIGFLKNKLKKDENEVNGLDMDRMKSQIDDLYARQEKINQHIKGQNLQNAITYQNQNSIVPIKSDQLLRVSQQIKLKQGKMRASYPGWYGGEQKQGGARVFLSGSLEDINHKQYLNNIQRKVDQKQQSQYPSEESLVLRVSSQDNDTSDEVIYSIEKYVEDDDSTGIKNPFDSQQFGGSSSTLESASPLPKEQQEEDQWQMILKPSPMQVAQIIQSREASKKGFTTKVTCVSMTPQQYLAMKRQEQVMVNGKDQKQIVEKKQIRSHSKYELEQLLNMSRIVEEKSEDFSQASPLKVIDIGKTKQQEVHFVNSEDEASLWFYGSVAASTQRSEFDSLRSIES